MSSRTSFKDTIGQLLNASQAKVSDLREGDNTLIGSYCNLPTNALSAGKYQPRKEFNDQALQELSISIARDGILQPLIVRSIGEEKYEIIAGERRWRASKNIGLTHVPAIVREVTDECALAFGILENLQREGLNPIEEGEAFRRLIKDFSLTHEEISQRVGKSRVYITNMIRLLKLPEEIQGSLARREIQMGHAKAIITLGPEKIQEAFKQIVIKKLSVRQTEALARKLNTRVNAVNNFVDNREHEIRALELELFHKLQLPCKIKLNSFFSGKLEISFDELDDLREKFLKTATDSLTTQDR